MASDLFLTMLLSFISRMVFIRCLSAAYLGVNGLFTDVLSILNFAELGIGTAMVFSMYEPAARNDEQKLARLMNLYKWMYRAVAASVLLFGLVLLPFLPYLIKDGEGIEHITLIYMMYVLSSACSYLLNYKSSIYQAYQKSYICTGWTLVCECIRTVVQIVALLLTGNFILYLAIQLVVQFIPNIIISHMADKEFPYLKECRELPEKEERNGILKNIGAMSMHKLATVIVRNTDSLLMSSFVGLLSVGIYSNYKLILSGIDNLLNKFSNAFAGSLGNLGAIEDETRVYSIYRELDLLFFVIYAYWTAGLFALFNAFITLCFGAEYCFSTATVAVLVTEFYISGQRKVNLLFREAKGLFWYDRYKPLFESAINLAASLLLVQKFGVAGILGGTIISTVTTCLWMEPYILMRYGIREDWQGKLKDYFVRYAERAAVVAVLAAVSYGWVSFCPAKNIGWFLLDGVLYTLLFGAVMVVLHRNTPEFNQLKGRVTAVVKRRKE